MNQLEHSTIDSISGATSHIIDRHRCLAALAYAEKRGIPKSEVMAIILEKRFSWLNWQTVTQRKWQSHTHRTSKAKHHDSIALREKYVRC